MSERTDETGFPWELDLDLSEAAAGPQDARGPETLVPPDKGAADEDASAMTPEPAEGTGSATEIRQDAPAAVTAESPRAAHADRRAPLVRKEYYSISEVSDIVGLPAHVLRYWESQFTVLNPSKNRSGNRVYQRKEIKLILLVKQLLHDEKYTVEGAKQRLDQLRRSGGMSDASSGALDSQLVQSLRADLDELSDLLAAGDA